MDKFKRTIWLARDDNEDLYLHFNKPTKKKTANSSSAYFSSKGCIFINDFNDEYIFAKEIKPGELKEMILIEK